MIRVEERDAADALRRRQRAFLRHHLIKVGFLPAWKDVVAESDRVRVFERLEANLNAIAEREGELRLTIPLAYIEARKR